MTKHSATRLDVVGTTSLVLGTPVVISCQHHNTVIFDEEHAYQITLNGSKSFELRGQGVEDASVKRRSLSNIGRVSCRDSGNLSVSAFRKICCLGISIELRVGGDVEG